MIFLMWDPIASLKSAKVVDAAKAIEKEPLGLILVDGQTIATSHDQKNPPNGGEK